MDDEVWKSGADTRANIYATSGVHLFIEAVNYWTSGTGGARYRPLELLSDVPALM